MAKPRIDRPRMSTVLTPTDALTSRGAALLQLAFANAPPDPIRGFAGRGSRCGVQPTGAQRETAAALLSAGMLQNMTGFGPGSSNVYGITLNGEISLALYCDSHSKARPAGLRAPGVVAPSAAAAQAELTIEEWKLIRGAGVQSVEAETVNHPPHYGGDTTYEVIKVLRAWGLDESFELGSAVKYLARLGKKNGANPIEDLKKARWYIDSKIAELEGKS